MYVNARAIIERSTPDGPEIILQVRDKPGQQPQLELPGGQVEPFESLLDALIREVREETGLDVTHIEGRAGRVVTSAEVGRVECVRPFAAYQTLAGPVDSMGVYFRCQARGAPRAQDGEVRRVAWHPVTGLATALKTDPERFSWVDRAGLTYYLGSLSAH